MHVGERPAAVDGAAAEAVHNLMAKGSGKHHDERENGRAGRVSGGLSSAAHITAAGVSAQPAGDGGAGVSEVDSPVGLG